MPKRRTIDFNDLRAIPILRVAEALGLPLVKTGPGTWAMKDPEKPREPTSLVLFEKNNRWKRFSRDEGGSTIDLVMHIQGCDLKTAADFLSRYL